MGKESVGGLIPASHPIRALRTPFLIEEKEQKCTRVLSSFLFYACPVLANQNAPRFHFSYFVHLCRRHPGCTSKHGGQKSRKTYQDTLRKGLGVEALLLLLALVMVVGGAGRHGFMRRVGAA